MAALAFGYKLPITIKQYETLVEMNDFGCFDERSPRCIFDDFF